MGWIFSFGNVEIQPAAEVGATIYINVNHPKRLQETIVLAQSELKNWEYGNQAQKMAAAMDVRGGVGCVGATVGSGQSGAGASQGGGSGAQNAAFGASAPQVAAELEKLFELKMKGALSEEEYVRAKNRLLKH